MKNGDADQSTGVVAGFVAAINARNSKQLSEWMTDDHVMTDAGGMRVIGRDRVSAAWREYFKMFPDYQMICDMILAQGSVVAVFGRADATFARGRELRPEDHWRLPAAWMAVVRGGRIAQWNVYCDSEPVRKVMSDGDRA